MESKKPAISREKEESAKGDREMERIRGEEELARPKIEIWLDPTDDWAGWIRRHERKKMGNPLDVCEVSLPMRASPLCPTGHH
jgi:hypothetical protein